MTHEDVGDVGAYFQHKEMWTFDLATAHTDYLGQRRIKLTRCIASTSNVYVARAVDSKHGKVAIKFSHPPVIDKEFAILLQLQDANIPGIARVYGSCWVDRFRGISLELFNNSLATIGTMELEKVVVMGKGMVSTLQAVHNLGIVHNDIKPENIVTSDQRNFYLIDWNVARRKTAPVPGYRVGTPLYMSVRTLEGKPGGERDDLESLLYTMVYLLHHDLPWLSVPWLSVPWLSEETVTESQYLSLAQMKRSFCVRQSSHSYPSAFQDFLDICRRDRGDLSSSDYTNLTSLLESIL